MNSHPAASATKKCHTDYSGNTGPRRPTTLSLSALLSLIWIPAASTLQPKLTAIEGTPRRNWFKRWGRGRGAGEWGGCNVGACTVSMWCGVVGVGRVTFMQSGIWFAVEHLLLSPPELSYGNTCRPPPTCHTRSASSV